MTTAKQRCMRIAREQAAQVWCEDRNKDKPMDADLAEAFAQTLYCWIAAHFNTQVAVDYYRDLLDESAQHLGEAVYFGSGGVKGEEAVHARIPELVAALAQSNADRLLQLAKDLEQVAERGMT